MVGTIARMRATYSYRSLKTDRPGFLLLMLLICIAIVAFLYAIRLQALLNPKQPSGYSDPNALPWEEDHLLTNDTLQAYGFDAETTIRPGQPELKRQLLFGCIVYQDTEPRGEMIFRIRSDGRIHGCWSAEYKTTSPDIYYSPIIPWKPDYNITVTDVDSKGRNLDPFGGVCFEGNVVPSKIYEDEFGKDPSKLYILAKGFLLQKAHNMRTNKEHKPRPRGRIFYVTGWMDTDYYTAGKLTTITAAPTTEETEVVNLFDWEGAPMD